MKKFTSWIKESKNIINEDVGFETPFANISRVASQDKTPLRKFSNVMTALKEKHPSDSISDGRLASSNRAELLNMISLIPYPDIKSFMKDWNYVKSHIMQMDPTADNPSVNDSPETKDSSDAKDLSNLNVDRK